MTRPSPRWGKSGIFRDNNKRNAKKTTVLSLSLSLAAGQSGQVKSTLLPEYLQNNENQDLPSRRCPHPRNTGLKIRAESNSHACLPEIRSSPPTRSAPRMTCRKKRYTASNTATRPSCEKKRAIHPPVVSALKHFLSRGTRNRKNKRRDLVTKTWYTITSRFESQARLLHQANTAHAANKPRGACLSRAGRPCPKLLPNQATPEAIKQHAAGPTSNTAQTPYIAVRRSSAKKQLHQQASG